MNNKIQGITLIALVITIIVLLILAGVTINLTLGEGGIFSKAQIAAKNYTNAQERELAELTEFEGKIDDRINNITLRINDTKGLKNFAEKVNSGDTFEGETIVLQGDIDLNEELNWTPIGSIDHPFAGTFDGKGHKIMNLNITTDEEYQGLFGCNTGTIKNVGIESGTLKVGPRSGGIVGRNTGIIESCYNKADITCENCWESGIGGVVGNTLDGSLVSKCFNEGNINSDAKGEASGAGGVVGYAEGKKNVVIQFCYNIGNVTVKQIGSVSNMRAGGIVNGGPGLVDSCYNRGVIMLEGGYKANAAVGGIATMSFQDISCIKNCYNSGTITRWWFDFRLGEWRCRKLLLARRIGGMVVWSNL